MATQADVRRIALALPEVAERAGQFGFTVLNKGKPKAFAWVWLERLAPKKARVPNPAVLALRVPNLAHKDLMLSADPARFFTEPHYDGYPAVLLRLDAVSVAELELLVADAWRCQAPPELARRVDADAGETKPRARRGANATKTAKAKKTAKRTASAVLLALALAAPRVSTAQAAQTARVDTAAIIASARAEIEEANAAWLPGLRSRDADAIVAAYADSGVFVTADGNSIRGRAAIAGMYRARFPRLPAIRDGAVVQGGLALLRPDVLVEWGSAWLELAPSAPGAPTRSGGSYVTLWQRQSDGHWRIVRNLAM